MRKLLLLLVMVLGTLTMNAQKEQGFNVTLGYGVGFLESGGDNVTATGFESSVTYSFKNKLTVGLYTSSKKFNGSTSDIQSDDYEFSLTSLGAELGYYLGKNFYAYGRYGSMKIDSNYWYGDTEKSWAVGLRGEIPFNNGLGIYIASDYTGIVSDTDGADDANHLSLSGGLFYKFR